VSSGVVNKWALKHYKGLTEEAIFVAMDELEAHITGTKKPTFLSSKDETYVLAKRFKGVLYRPFLKQKPMKIIQALIDRCGQAYYDKDLDLLYIPKETIDEWVMAFQIPPDKADDYIRPLLILKVLEPSDRREYVYKVSHDFFRLVGEPAQYLVDSRLSDPAKFGESMEIVSGLTSVYVLSHSVKVSQYVEEGARIPWFLKLAMVYTFSGLDPVSKDIRDVLEPERINAVDDYFVIEKGFSAEFWKSTRVDAFTYMTENRIIENTTSEGYKLNTLWVRLHKEAVRRYVQRIITRYRAMWYR
jgi:phosphopantetheine adenylyltransferase